jgi:hypothetical protein
MLQKGMFASLADETVPCVCFDHVLFLVPITWKSYFFEITTGNKYDEAK